ncbi:MAG: hypothetical protein ACRCXT_22310 [Paraclostridium sp.]
MLLYLSLIDTEEDKAKFEEIFNSYKKTMYYGGHRSTCYFRPLDKIVNYISTYDY